MIHRMGCTLMYQVRRELLGSVDASIILHMGCTVMHKRHGESLEGVDPSMIGRMRSKHICRGCVESLACGYPSKMYCMISTPRG